MDIFELAILEVQREQKIHSKNVMGLIFNRAEKILKYMDMQDRNKKVAKNRYKKLAFEKKRGVKIAKR